MRRIFNDRLITLSIKIRHLSSIIRHLFLPTFGEISYMKLVSYLKEEQDQLAVLVDGLLYDMEYLHPDLPNTMAMFLNYWEDALPMAQGGVMMIEEGKIAQGKGTPVDSVQLLAPIPFPAS